MAASWRPSLPMRRHRHTIARRRARPEARAHACGRCDRTHRHRPSSPRQGLVVARRQGVVDARAFIINPVVAHATYGRMIRATSAHADAPTPAMCDETMGYSVVRGKARGLGGDHGGEHAEVEDDEGTRAREGKVREWIAREDARPPTRGACVYI